MAGAVFWLALGFGLLWLFRRTPSGGGSLFGGVQLLVGLTLIGLGIPLAWRLLHRHLLWSLRNKLILTYVLIGLAPVVLFVTWVTISAYIAAGQFSIHLADSRMRQELDEMGVENSARAERMARVMREREEGMGPPPFRPPPRRGASTPQPAASTTEQTSVQAAGEASVQASAETALSSEALPNPLRARLHPHASIYLNGAPLPTLAGPFPAPLPQLPATKTPLGLPAWAADLHGREFRGMVLDGEDLFLVAVDQRHAGVGQLVTVVTSLPVDSGLI